MRYFCRENTQDHTMRKYKSFAYLAILAISSLVLFSCQSKTPHNSRKKKVLILQSYSENNDYSKKATKLYEEAFSKENLNVDLTFRYGGMPNMPRMYLIPDFLSSLIDTMTVYPDVVILNDDDIFHAVMSDSAWACRMPIVFGGVTYVDENRYSKLNNVTGFIDKPDIKTNLELIKELTNTQFISIELGDKDQDRLRYKDLVNAINDLGMVYDRKQRLNQMQILEIPKGNTTFVSTLSGDNPYLALNDTTNSSSEYITENYFQNAKYAKHLQLRWTSTSNTYIDRSEAPQFTAVNEQFGDVNTRFLAGYFTPLETQIADEVSYAAEILRGTSIRILPQKEHKKEYFMDYNAMKQLNLKVSDYEDKFTIINIPYQIEHPFVFWSMVIIGILGIISIISLVTYAAISSMNRKQEMMLNELKENLRKRELALGQSMTTLWQIKNGIVNQLGSNRSISVDEFREFIHPDHRNIYDQVLAMNQPNGKQVVRVKIAYDQKNYQWEEIIYNLTDKNKTEKHLEGVRMNIDDLKKQEESILKANENEELVNIKETIMANMSHDIRTPLGAVVGFADIMVAEGEMLSDEERMEYAEIIKQNSQMLETMIGDILDEKSEVGIFKFYKKNIKVSTLIHQVWQNNKVLCPKHLEFKEQQENHTELTLYVDSNRIQEVLNNFLSNAFKFTPTGSIIVGWRIAAMEIELYVQDTGIGIAKEDLDSVFERYYKTAETHKGTGMGLNICKTIIEQHNGHVNVSSELGKGSRFSAFLPIVDQKGGQS